MRIFAQKARKKFLMTPKMGHFGPFLAEIHQKSQRYCKKFLKSQKSLFFDDFSRFLRCQLQTYNSLSIAERDVPNLPENPRAIGR